MKVLQNSVQLMGNLGKDIELMQFSSGNKKAFASLATTDYFKNGSGEIVKNTHWHNIYAWGKTAERMHEMLQKGNQVLVHGTLKTRTYESKEGMKYITEVEVSEFYRIQKSKEYNQEPESPPFPEPIMLEKGKR